MTGGMWQRVEKIPHEIRAFLTSHGQLADRTYLVGGAVRDLVMGNEPKDWDFEIFGLRQNELDTVLRDICVFWEFKGVTFGNVGASYGITNVRFPSGLTMDLGLPRVDRNTGAAHRDFEVGVDPFMPIMSAARRRDFTMNAMYMDAFTGELLDFYNGVEDIERGVIQHVNTQTFPEDPLRVLRAVQFAARFGMKIDPATQRLCRVTALHGYKTIPKERVWIEWEKILTKGKRPSMALRALMDTGLLVHYPWLQLLDLVEQEPDWHPEGNVWEHTLQVTDEAARIADRDNLQGEERMVLILAAICHDLGKPFTTVHEPLPDGTVRIKSPGHAEAGEKPAREFLNAIMCPDNIKRQVIPLVLQHMVYGTAERVTARVARRMAVRLHPSNIPMLERLVEADASGRKPAPPARPMQHWLEVAVEANVTEAPPVRFIGGQMLIDRGLNPGKDFTDILKDAYGAQVEGFFDKEDAEAWLDDYLIRHGYLTTAPSVV